MIREEFESWLKEEGYTGDPFDEAWNVWQAATQSTIKRIQAAASEPVLLPGAIVLPGDFFAKVK